MLEYYLKNESNMMLPFSLGDKSMSLYPKEIRKINEDESEKGDVPSLIKLGKLSLRVKDVAEKRLDKGKDNGKKSPKEEEFGKKDKSGKELEDSGK